ncbi:MAG: hypothetical protein LC808_29175 [Actinobacteria bacterium]|nr:hypothetical protein [Actinomycetota bacterium]
MSDLATSTLWTHHISLGARTIAVRLLTALVAAAICWSVAPPSRTKAASETYSPPRSLTFIAATHVGYQFSSTGAVLATKTYTLTSTSHADTSQRATIAGQSGYWFKVVNGIWTDYWVRESTAIYLPGIVGLTSFAARAVNFAAGTHTGYQFSSTGAVTASRTATLASPSSATADSRAIINGAAHLAIISGTWTGFWVRESSAVALSGTTAVSAPIFIHYYMWWTPRHWQEKLGPNYPYASVPPPIPGAMDASGCNPTVKYTGATIVDIPSEGLSDQGQAATFDRHIVAAAQAGITGFLVNWQGTGQSGQTPSSSGYNTRLELLVSRVEAYNSTHVTPFRLGLALDAYGDYSRSSAAILNDISYFRGRYAARAAFKNPFDAQPIVMLMASRRFAVTTIQTVSSAVQSSVFLLGDETYKTWTRDAPYLDGTGWYWSSQDPWGNPQSGSQVASLADQVRLAGKRFFAPFTPGYNTQLIGGSTCVPRNGTRTLEEVWRLNSASRPNGWFGISWNEIVENTYMQPSRTYGTAYVDSIRRLSGH